MLKRKHRILYIQSIQTTNQRETNTKKITKGLAIVSISSAETCCLTPYEKDNNKTWQEKLAVIYKMDHILWKITGKARNRILILQHSNNTDEEKAECFAESFLEIHN